MKRIFEDNPASVGNTPLVRLNRVVDGKAVVLAKVEGRNPSFSVKCRVGVALIKDAEEKGLLKRGMSIVEPTSGNTGIALAYAAAARDYKLVLTMPENMSLERRKVLASLGADLILTPAAEGLTGSVEKAEEILASDPARFYMPQQFKNPANPAAHENSTGPEIWRDTGGEIDALVATVGTGGTLSGIAKYIKKTAGKNITVVAVEPEESPVISRFLAGKPLNPAPHKIQGIGAGFIPETLDLSLVDRVETVKSGESMAFARRMAKEEGIMCGISSGAAVAVAARLAGLPEFFGKTIVAVLPDSSERYLSTELFSED